MKKEKSSNDLKTEIHPIKPEFDENSEILILGSFPSVKSREEKYFYAHPQNRFWKVLATVFEDEVPKTVDEKRKFLLKNRVAVWDVIKSCSIKGSSDSSITDVEVNDLSVILENSNVKRIFVNGRKSQQFYKKYIEKDLGIEACYLPSTSPANAAWNLEKLVDEWKIIKER